MLVDIYIENIAAEWQEKKKKRKGEKCAVPQGVRGEVLLIFSLTLSTLREKERAACATSTESLIAWNGTPLAIPTTISCVCSLLIYKYSSVYNACNSLSAALSFDDSNKWTMKIYKEYAMSSVACVIWWKILIIRFGIKVWGVKKTSKKLMHMRVTNKKKKIFFLLKVKLDREKKLVPVVVATISSRRIFDLYTRTQSIANNLCVSLKFGIVQSWIDSLSSFGAKCHTFYYMNMW